jgi:hypothetical protein
MEKQDVIENFIELGFLEEDDMFVRTTPRGRLVLDEISSRLI